MYAKWNNQLMKPARLFLKQSSPFHCKQLQAPLFSERLDRSYWRPSSGPFVFRGHNREAYQMHFPQNELSVISHNVPLQARSNMWLRYDDALAHFGRSFRALELALKLSLDLSEVRMSGHSFHRNSRLPWPVETHEEVASTRNNRDDIWDVTRDILKQ